MAPKRKGTYILSMVTGGRPVIIEADSMNADNGHFLFFAEYGVFRSIAMSQVLELVVNEADDLARMWETDHAAALDENAAYNLRFIEHEEALVENVDYDLTRQSTINKFAEILRAERQYALEHNILRTEYMNDDQSQERHDGRVAADKRAREQFMALFDALTDQEMRAYGDYRKTH
jgi:hypothetical protein